LCSLPAFAAFPEGGQLALMLEKAKGISRFKSKQFCENNVIIGHDICFYV
jgi:hypothetical protein